MFYSRWEIGYAVSDHFSGDSREEINMLLLKLVGAEPEGPPTKTGVTMTARSENGRRIPAYRVSPRSEVEYNYVVRGMGIKSDVTRRNV